MTHLSASVVVGRPQRYADAGNLDPLIKVRIHFTTRCTSCCKVLTTSVIIMGLLQLRYEHDSSTIRLRFDYDSATTRYNTLRGFSCARIRDRIRESVVGVSCMLIDSSMHTAFTV